MNYLKTGLIQRVALLLISAVAFVTMAEAIDIWVAPNGNNSSAGTRTAPLQTLEGARNRVRTLSKNQDIRVLFKAGTYRFTKQVDFNSRDSGANGRAIVYQSAPNETAFFDGGRVIPRGAFTKVGGNTVNRLAQAARGNVWSAAISDSTTRQLLSNDRNGVNLNGFLFRPAENPNNSYYNIRREFSNGSFQIWENEDFPLLQRELDRNGSQAELFGYVRREFAAYRRKINKFGGGGNSVIEPADGGFPGQKGDLDAGPRVKIRNMLGVVDIAREWFFDTRENRLYIFPPGGNLAANAEIVVWGGERAINCQGVRNVYFHNLVIQNFATADTDRNRFKSVVEMQSCDNVRLRGCTLRRISVPLAPFSIEGRSTNCLVDSCDVYDNGRGSRLRGGGIRTGQVTTGNNRVSNCHFTRVDLYSSLGTAIGIEGRANRFIGNLVHNTSRQSIVYQGFDHEIDLNEIYNVNQDEGDGGAIYTGASLVAHGTKLRRNLIHHNIGIPGLIPRAGIYFDDFGAGNAAEENILFKGGAFAIYSNRGTANTIQRNIIVKSFSGARSGGGGTRAYNTAMDYLNRVGNRTPDQNIKENYVGQMLRIAGKSGWLSRVNSNNWHNEIDPFWTNRYSRFGISMDKYFQQKTMIPFETRIYDNFFAENDQNFQAPRGSNERGSRTFNLSQMVNVNGNLDFRWRSGQRPAGSPNTSDFNPGLTTGTFRRSVPSRNDYRSKVARFFSNIPSFESGVSYDRGKANRNRYNSGRDNIGASQSGLGVREGDAGKNTGSSGGGGGGSNPPGGGESFAIRFDRPPTPSSNTSRTAGSSIVVRVSGSNIANVRLFRNNSLVRQENGAPYEWGLPNQPDAALKNLQPGSYTYRAVGTSRSGQTSEISFRITVPQPASNPPSGGGGGGGSPGSPTNAGDTGSFFTADSYLWDFGTANSPLFRNSRRVTEGTSRGFARWTNTSGLASRDRGRGNQLNQDFVFGNATRTFRQQLPRGRYQIRMNLFDSNVAHDGMYVKVEGIDRVVNFRAGPNFPNVTQDFRVDVTDGFLDVEMSDRGGSDQNWVLNRIQVDRVGEVAAEQSVAGNAGPIRLDLGTNNSPVQNGYQRLSPQNRSGAIRWSGAVASRDRGTARGTNNLNRDFVFSGASRDLILDGLQNGTWRVEVTFGDRSGRHDEMQVRFNGRTIIDNVDTAAGQYLVRNAEINVNDGTARLNFNDAGGSDPNWVVTRVRLFRQ